MHEVRREMTLARIEQISRVTICAHSNARNAINADQYIVEYETSSPWVLVVRGS